LAETINECHSSFLKSAESAINFAIAAGESLLRAKKNVPHGSWQNWLATYVHFSTRAANRYMRIARLYPTLMAKETGRADFNTIGKTIAALTKPLDKAGDAKRKDSTGSDESEGKQREARSDGDAGSKDADARADEGSDNAETEGTDATNAESDEETADHGADDRQQADAEPEGEPSRDDQQDPVEHFLDGRGLTVDERRRLIAAINRDAMELVSEVMKGAWWRAKRIIVNSRDDWDVPQGDIAVAIGKRVKEVLDPVTHLPRVRTGSRPAAAC
jgi:hypothetical protein